MTLSVDLAKEALKELRFLAVINQHQELLESGNALKLAIYRYEKYWLPLVGTLPEDYTKAGLSPPLDVYWIWHCHMLSPVVYAQDMKRMYLHVINHKFPGSRKEEKERREEAARQWNRRFSRSPAGRFRLDETVPVPSFKSEISYDLEAAVLRQRDFYYNVSLPHFKDPLFLQNAVERYQRFLTMKKNHRDMFVTPMYDIDLLWHTHQLHPLAYAADMTSWLGYVLNHDDTDQDRDVGSKLSNAHVETAKLYQRKFGCSYYSSGCSYRGPPPRHALVPETEERRADISTGIQVINFESVKVTDLPSGSALKLQVVKLDRDNQQARRSLVRKDTKTHWSGSRHGYKLDSFRHRALRFAIIAEKGFCCFGKKEIVAHYDILLQSATPSAQSVEKTVPFVLDCNNEDYSKAKLDLRYIYRTDWRAPRNRGPCLLEMRAKDFSVQNPIPRDTWGPVPVPPSAATSAGNVATHSLVNHLGRECLRVKVVHSLDIIMSACLVTDENDQLQAAAHLVGTNQLPLPDNVQEKFPALVTVQPRKGERAILVKDAAGDYAVIVGRWEVFQNGRRQRDASVQNPGFLRVKFLNLRERRAQLVNCPTRDKKSKSKSKSGGKVSFTYRLGHVTVNMETGEIRIKKTSTSIAASVAVGLGVSLLFVLCNPWSGRPEVQYTGPPPPYQAQAPAQGPAVTRRNDGRFQLSDLAILCALGFFVSMVPTMFFLHSQGHQGVHYVGVAGDYGEVAWEEGGETELEGGDTGSVAGGMSAGGESVGGCDVGGEDVGEGGGGCVGGDAGKIEAGCESFSPEGGGCGGDAGGGGGGCLSTACGAGCGGGCGGGGGCL